VMAHTTDAPTPSTIVYPSSLPVVETSAPVVTVLSTSPVTNTVPTVCLASMYSSYRYIQSAITILATLIPLLHHIDNILPISAIPAPTTSPPTDTPPPAGPLRLFIGYSTRPSSSYDNASLFSC
jgi:hypothetical protein